MIKTNVPPQMVVDRLEKKYQRKIRFQKYKNATKQLRQKLMSVRGTAPEELDDDSFSIFNFTDYKYITR
jgi:hypothetical protein